MSEETIPYRAMGEVINKASSEDYRGMDFTDKLISLVEIKFIRLPMNANRPFLP